MSLWLIAPILAAVGVATSAFLARKKLPRDSTREKENTPESTLAYERVSNSLPFLFIRGIVLRELQELRPQEKLIDIGCGPGYLVRDIKKKRPDLPVIGLDLSHEILELAVANRRNGPQVSFLKADAGRIPLTDNSVDVAISTLSLHHWKDALAVLSELHRILTPGGRLLIFDLRRDTPYALYYGGMAVQRWLCPPSIRQVNGLMGSLYSSYTTLEMERLMRSSPFKDFEVRRGWGWAYIHTKKQSNSL